MLLSYLQHLAMLQHEWFCSIVYVTDRFECSGVGDGKAWINRQALWNYRLLNFLRLTLKDQIENEQGVMETHQPWFPDSLGWHILSCPFGWTFTSVVSSGKSHSQCESPFVSGWCFPEHRESTAYESICLLLSIWLSSPCKLLFPQSN